MISTTVEQHVPDSDDAIATDEDEWFLIKILLCGFFVVLCCLLVVVVVICRRQLKKSHHSDTDSSARPRFETYDSARPVIPMIPMTPVPAPVIGKLASKALEVTTCAFPNYSATIEKRLSFVVHSDDYQEQELETPRCGNENYHITTEGGIVERGLYTQY